MIKPFFSLPTLASVFRSALLCFLAGSMASALIAAPAVAATPPASSDLLARADTVSRLTATSLERLAPDADPDVIALGIATMQCAQRHGVGEQAQRLAVIDYSRS